MRILWKDDPGWHEIVRRILSDDGHEVSFVEGHGDILPSLKAGSFDLVVMNSGVVHGGDIETPGLLTLRAIRAEPTLAELPIIVFSGAIHPDLERAVVAAKGWFVFKGGHGFDNVLAHVRELARAS